MTDTRTTQPRSGLVTGARWALAALAGLFTLGALGQFFLVGMGMFEDAARWKDHETLGHMIGLLPYVMWIPAALGRTGARVILATVLLYVLFMAQYAFINVDSGIANAFHPLNGAVMLMLGAWLTGRAVGLARDARRRPVAAEHPGRERRAAGALERTSS